MTSKGTVPSVYATVAGVRVLLPLTSKVHYAPNLKKPGSMAWQRFEEYRKAKTLGDALRRGSYCGDITYDINKGFLRLPNCRIRRRTMMPAHQRKAMRNYRAKLEEAASRMPMQRRSPKRTGRPYPRGPYRWTLSLGSRCFVAQALKELGLRSGAGPLDQMYSCAQVVRNCLRDNFETLLDKRMLVTRRRSTGQQVGDHKAYRRIMCRKNVVFPHKGPDRHMGIYRHWVKRFLHILRRPERKLLVLGYQAPLDRRRKLRALRGAPTGNSKEELIRLYEDLCERGVQNFELLAIRLQVSGKETGGRETGRVKVLQRLGTRDQRFCHVGVRCYERNTGLYFRDPRDRRMFKGVIKGKGSGLNGNTGLHGRKFSPLPDPLPRDGKDNEDMLLKKSLLPLSKRRRVECRGVAS